ncbi:Uncharacterised protein [Candidatus Tiddalikarchaeum anstoanum]|nr:Uncharacterised protein [Candidatus Tiddalikarchaeum anstoanum]
MINRKASELPMATIVVVILLLTTLIVIIAAVFPQLSNMFSGIGQVGGSATNELNATTNSLFN